MSVNARTLPIALVLAGAIIISTAVYAYAFGQHADSFLTSIIVIAILIGFIAIILGWSAYLWERDKYYKDRLEIHL